MSLPRNKTKIVATIGPASASPETLQRMIRAGMTVARLNFSHGNFESHGTMIRLVREAARSVGRPVAIMADLPGPKMRIGQIREEHVELKTGETFILTTDDVPGDARRVSVSFEPLPRVVRRGDKIFINDGMIQLEVLSTQGRDISCEVEVGGELRSRKGLNVPGIDLGICAFTREDRKCLEFALGEGVDAISQSFVEDASDVNTVREGARALGHDPFIIAKIERATALDHIDEILAAADGIMVARGDLGVEIPIERIAAVQKDLVRRANLLGRPVITATQMLESMTTNRRPTRAEATDVANAILDGTDCVMLSGESAMGQYPVESVAMLARIAAAIEPLRPAAEVREVLKRGRDEVVELRDLIAVSVEAALEWVAPVAVVVPSRTGGTARSITRFRLPVWLLAFSARPSTCRSLLFSYGVAPLHKADEPEDWSAFIRQGLQEYDLSGDLVVLAAGPSERHPEANVRMEIIDLRRGS